MNVEKTRVVGAHVSRPNTPESDGLPEVEHDVAVALSSRSTEIVRVFAACPMAAIEKVRTMSAIEYSTLHRPRQERAEIDADVSSAGGEPLTQAEGWKP